MYISSISYKNLTSYHQNWGIGYAFWVLQYHQETTCGAYSQVTVQERLAKFFLLNIFHLLCFSGKWDCVLLQVKEVLSYSDRPAEVSAVVSQCDEVTKRDLTKASIESLKMLFYCYVYYIYQHLQTYLIKTKNIIVHCSSNCLLA